MLSEMFFPVLVGVVLVVLSLVVSSCSIGITRHNNAAIVKLVELGKSPHEARCAIKTCDKSERLVHSLSAKGQ